MYIKCQPAVAVAESLSQKAVVATETKREHITIILAAAMPGRARPTDLNSRVRSSLHFRSSAARSSISYTSRSCS